MISNPSADVSADVATLLARLTADRAGFLDNIDNVVLATLETMRGTNSATLAPSMSWAGSTAKVVVTGTAADLDFTDVVIAGIPAGVTLKRVDAVLITGFTFDTSGSENQIKTGTTGKIHVKANAAAWSTCIDAIPVPALSYETKLDDYGGGGPLFGNIDIKATVTGNGTYNFRSEETNQGEAIEATGADLELQVVSIVVRAWW